MGLGHVHESERRCEIGGRHWKSLIVVVKKQLKIWKAWNLRCRSCVCDVFNVYRTKYYKVENVCCFCCFCYYFSQFHYAHLQYKLLQNLNYTLFLRLMSSSSMLYSSTAMWFDVMCNLVHPCCILLVLSSCNNILNASFQTG